MATQLVKMQMNSCLICNETFVSKTLLTPEDGKAAFDNVCKILQIPEPNSDSYVTESNPLCVSCVGVTEAFFSLQNKIQKLITALGKLREIFAQKAVSSYLETPSSRKNYGTKKHIYDVWLSKIPSDHASTSQNEHTSGSNQTVEQIVGTCANIEQDDTCSSVISPIGSPVNDYDDDFINCDANELGGGGQQNNEFIAATVEEQAQVPVVPESLNILENKNEQQQQNNPPEEDNVVKDKKVHFATNELQLKHRNTGRKTTTNVKLRRSNHQCRYCGHLAANNFALEMHVRTHTGERPYVCSIRLCGKKFVSNGAKTAHEKTHDSSRREGEPKYKCDLCDRKYHLLLSLRCHQARHKKGLNFRTKPDPGAPKKVYPRNKPTPCPICGKILTRTDKLKPHLKLHEENKIPKELTAPPTKRSGFRKWLKGKVNKEDAENGGDGSPKAKAGRSKKAKQLGRRARNLARSKECSECGNKFSTSILLTLHMRVHTGETPYECEICHRRFARPENKSKHMKIHDPNRFQGEAKHICDLCGKSFYLQHTLYNHRKFSHPGVVNSDARGPSACPICGKIIHDKLKKHMARHSEATKIHKCEVCQRPFFTTAEAKNHAVHYHNPDKLLRLLFKIKCPACPPEYFGHPSKRAVKIHWLEHHKDKPMPAEYRKSRYNISAYNKKGRFECPHCPETKRPVYSQKVSLKRHVSKLHPDKVEVRKRSENSCKRRSNPRKKNMETDDEEESTSSGSSSSEEEELNLDDDESDNDEAPKDVKRSARIKSKKIAISSKRRNPIKKVKPVETSKAPPQMGNKHVKIQL